jgi:hypothetical protein
VNDACRDCVNLAERAVAMQMRVDSGHPVKRIRQKARDFPRGHRLAWLESPILPHVGEVRRNQTDFGRAQLAGRRCREEERQ